MIPIHFVFYSDLDQRTEQAFRDLTLSSEYSDLSYSIRHGGDLAAPVGRTPVLITGDPIRLKKANELNFRTVFCAEADQLADCSFDVLWPAEETVVEREAHFRQLLHLLMMEHLAWEYEMLLDVTIDTVPDLIWYKRLDGIHMKVNDTFAKTVQKDKSDIRGKDHYYIWNAPRPAEGGTLGRDCSTSEEMTIRSGKTCSFEEELETREGIKQLVTYKTPVYDSFGKVYGTVGLGHDVTNIRNLGNELSILVENIPLPMFAATTDWVAVRMNSAFMELSGTDNSEMEAFDYKKWKEECLLPSSEAVVDRERHIVKQEFSWTGDGETKIFLVMEQEVRDHFDHISGYFCLLEDVTLQRMHLQEMDQMVTTDVLTGLYNRRFFYSYLTEQADKLWTLLYMDLDGFKGVNDTFGHHFGDKTLIRVAELLRELFPQSKAIRLGGDEFAVLLESEMQEGVIQSKIHELEERVEGLIPEKPGLLSISVGVVARRGEIVDIYAPDAEHAVRVEFFDDVVDRISEINVLTGELIRGLEYAAIFPASHYAVSGDRREKALGEIEAEMIERVEFFKSQNKLLEAQRIEERTKYDLEMLREVGFCSGIENYSRVLSGREPGSMPYTLLDYFPRDFLFFVDESHVTIPQVRGMSGGDTARKKNLVDYGFRLPSAYDNRPLKFPEFEAKIGQTVFVSATPAEYEREHSTAVVEQIIRPTGLIDPEIFVRPVEGQVDDLIGEIKRTVGEGGKVLVTTLTTKMAEDLTDYFSTHGIRVRYIHHNVETIERMEIIRDLRLGVFDVLVGINLLREGLDIPEVSLVAILDADKEGLLRSETSLIQTIGRAARNVNGRVVMYADTVTRSMRAAIDETERRRKIQSAYNEAHGITPQSVSKKVREVIEISRKAAEDSPLGKLPGAKKKMTAKEKDKMIATLTTEMKDAAAHLDFETAAFLRDRIRALRESK